MENIKINDTILENVSIVDSGDILGLHFDTAMTLTQIDSTFNPEVCPEFYIIDDNGDTIGFYKNRKIVSVRVENNTADIALLVVKGEVDQVEELTARIEAQSELIEQQTKLISEQDEKIAELEARLEETTAMMTAIEEGIANA